ncbi:MAG TPA: hypothetical protein VN894_17220 [Polyangiaceae bacterium]|nr:hypothetical protein [Polyangiaceae bacterium]
MGVARNAWTVALAGLWLGFIATVACGERHGGGAGTGPVCKTYDACTVLTASDAAAATGSKFAPGVETDTTAATGAASARCDYDTGKTTDPFVSALVRCCPCGDADPDATAQSYAGDGTTVTTVTGIGDSALWIETSADAGAPLIDQLVVFVGTELEVVVTVSVSLGQVFAFDPLAAAKQMARAALSRL